MDSNAKNGDQTLGYFVQLYKRPHVGYPSENQNGYLVFGYFDELYLQPYRNSQELLELVNNTKEVTGQMVFVSSTPFVRDMPPLLSIVWLMVNDEKDGIFAYAKCLQDEINQVLGKERRNDQHSILKANVFVSTGASQIGIILTEQYDKDSPKKSAHFMLLERAMPAIRELKGVLYAYMITACKPDLIVEESETWDQCLKRVEQSFILRTNIDGMSQSQLGQQICATIRKLLANPNCNWRQIHDSENLSIYMYDVSLVKLASMHLRETERMEGGFYAAVPNKRSLWYGAFSHGMNTRVFWDPNSDYGQSELQFICESKLVQDETRDRKANEYIQSIRFHAQQLADSLEKHWRTFKNLRNNPFTNWEYESYADIILLYLRLRKRITYLEATGVRLLTELEDESFFDRLEHAISATQNTNICFTDAPGYRAADDPFYSRTYASYTGLLNCLANEMDILAMESHPHHKIHHRFLLTMQNDSRVAARMYFQRLPPDERLISIFVPSNMDYALHRLMPLLLHEAGHFISLRRRNKSPEIKKSRTEYFFDLVACQILRELHIAGVQTIVGNSSKPVNIYVESDDPCIKMLASHWAVFLGLRYEHIRSILETAYAEAVTSRTNDLKEACNHADEIVREIYDNEINFTKENYSKDMAKLSRILVRESIFEIGSYLKSSVYAYIDTAAREYQLLSSSIDLLFNDLNDLVDHAYKIFSINQSEKISVLTALAQLNEPAADVFMIKMTGMNWIQYAWFMFEQWLTPELDKCRLKDILGSPTAYTRYASIAYCLSAKGLIGEKECLEKLIDQHVINKSGDKKPKQILELFEYFLESIEAVKSYNDVFDSLYANSPATNLDIIQIARVCKYVVELYDDPRYGRVTEKEKGTAAKIKSIYTSAFTAATQNDSSSLLDVFKGLLSQLDKISLKQ